MNLFVALGLQCLLMNYEKVQKVLDALGHPEALTTSRSIVADFIPLDLRNRKSMPLGEFLKKHPHTTRRRKPGTVVVLGELSKKDEEFVAAASDKLGIKLSASDFIWEVAERL